MHKNSLFVLVALVLAAASSYALLRWTAHDAGGGAQKNASDLGSIKGLVGCVVGWDLVDEGDEWIVTDADLGGSWAKDTIQCQYPLTVAPTVQPEDEHYHQYTYDTETSGKVYKTVQAQSIEVDNVDGTCWQMDANDPQWWWTPNVVYENRGIVLHVNTGTGWSGVSGAWSSTHKNSPGSYASQNGGHGPYPNGVGVDGEVRVAHALPTVARGSSIRVLFKWKVTGSATVDNACVQQWYEVVTYTALSALSEEAASVDFDLAELVE